MARSGLGKGLGALIGTPTAPARADAVESGERVHQINLANIVPSALQPRKNFALEALQELVDSIRQHGIIQPLIVRPAAASPFGGGQVGTRFELIAGERRWRAAQEAGLTQAPVIIRSAGDMEVLELSLIENLQRADLNPIEEAQGYARLAKSAARVKGAGRTTPGRGNRVATQCHGSFHGTAGGTPARNRPFPEEVPTRRG